MTVSPGPPPSRIQPENADFSVLQCSYGQSATVTAFVVTGGAVNVTADVDDFISGPEVIDFGTYGVPSGEYVTFLLNTKNYIAIDTVDLEFSGFGIITDASCIPF
ncbi:MAG: hypothetical protein ACRDX8_07860 [Acidimicrobiales bacterium]